MAEADDHLASAKREAEQQRLAAEQETNALRTSAARESEPARAEAEREVQEARRALAVEKERLTREAAENHDAAVAETKRLVDEAEERSDAAEQRAREATEARQRPPASRPTQEAEQLSAVRAARPSRSSARPRSRPTRCATAVTPTPSASSQALKAEVDRLTRRRDSITAQLSALRDVVAGFGDDDDELAAAWRPSPAEDVTEAQLESDRQPAPGPRSLPVTSPRTDARATSRPPRGPSRAERPGDHNPFVTGFLLAARRADRVLARAA